MRKTRTPGGQQERDAAEREQRGIVRLPPRRRDDENRAQQQERERFDARRPRGTGEQRLVEEVLQELRVDLDAGHGDAERRVLVFDHPDAGHADQHQLLAQLLRIESAFQYVDRRDVAIRAARREVDARRAVRFGRREERGGLDAFDRIRGHVQSQRRRTQGDADHLDRQRRHQRSVDARDQRDAANDSALGHYRDEAAADRRAIELVDAGQHAGVTR